MRGQSTRSGFPKENGENSTNRKGKGGKRSQKLALNTQEVAQHDTEFGDIAAYRPQSMPVVVKATGLTSPPATSDYSSASSTDQGGLQVMQKDFIANARSNSFIPATSANGFYQKCALPVEDLPSRTHFHWQVVSPAEAIQRSHLHPIYHSDPRFKLRQLPTGGQAWIFTSSNSKKFWLEQCRGGIAYANSLLLADCGPVNFVPIDPSCPLVERLILDTSFLGDSIVLGAKRWFSIVRKDKTRKELYKNAMGSKILKLNHQQQTNPNLSQWQPLSFATSSTNLALLFLACVWVEASLSSNTCFDWETKEDLLEWFFKPSDNHASAFEEKTVSWAFAVARKGLKKK